MNMQTNTKKLKIEINDLVKIYKQGSLEVVALRGLYAKFYEGEIVVIEGPSGCGKTTLVNLMAGLDRPDAGQIIVYNNGIEDRSVKKTEKLDKSKSKVVLTKLSNKELEIFRRKRVGVVFQLMNLIPMLTAEENITLPLMLNGRSRKERKIASESLLNITRMSERAKHKPDELSGGEQQRVAIASALANDPDIILADEPTGELDSENREEILDVFRELIDSYPNKCLIIVTHDKAIERIADRVLTINDGILVHEYVPGLQDYDEVVPQQVQQEISQYRKSFSALKKKLGSLTEAFKEIEDNLK
jgi:putative ABC transport system ATP-binding protein